MGRDFEDEIDRRLARKAERAKDISEKSKVVTDASWSRARATAKEMAASGDWNEAKPIHFVALNALLFERVYGFEMLDMTPTIRLAACGMAAALGRGVFQLGSEPAAGSKFACYLRWAWERESDREEWRRRNKRGGQTLGWRLVFGRSLLNEYASDIARQLPSRVKGV